MITCYMYDITCIEFLNILFVYQGLCIDIKQLKTGYKIFTFLENIKIEKTIRHE